MSEIICHSCNGVLDTTDIEPFTVCDCLVCGAEVSIPLEMEYLRLERFVGKKGIFKIYEGFDRIQNLNSIICILEKGHPEYKKFLNICKKDAMHLSILKHPNISPILNFGEIGGNFFVTEPKMDGYPISHYSPATEKLSDVKNTINILLAVASGIALAHHKEFVHHNLCADNIHIDARGIARTKNFFISRFEYSYHEGKKNAPITVSPYYISSEKVENHTEDKSGDVFSFGVLSYYMLTGKYPFSGKKEVDIVYSRINKKKNSDKSQAFSMEKPSVITAGAVDYVPPVAPVDICKNVPKTISSLVMDMLSYYPQKRPKFTEIINTINLHMAGEEKEKDIARAQQKMVRNKQDFSTSTMAIPLMKNHAGEFNKNKKKFFDFF